MAYSAEKYWLAPLTAELVAIVGKSPVAGGEVAAVAALAAAHGHLEAVSAALLARCEVEEKVVEEAVEEAVEVVARTIRRSAGFRVAHARAVREVEEAVVVPLLFPEDIV